MWEELGDAQPLAAAAQEHEPDGAAGTAEQFETMVAKQRGPGLALSDRCFKEIALALRIYLPPRYLGGEGLVKGINAKLSTYLMKYIEELDGVMLAYWNVAFLDNYARILFERPELHFRITLNALLFSPTPGSHLVGEVNKIGQDHIGLLVLGIFNASITAQAMGRFVFVPGEEEESQDRWQNAEYPELVIATGTEVRFQVIRVVVGDGGMVSIVGAMSAEGTGPTSALEYLVQQIKDDKKRKKRKDKKRKHNTTETNDKHKRTKKQKKTKKTKDKEKLTDT